MSGESPDMPEGSGNQDRTTKVGNAWLERGSLAALLLGTLVAYLWNLSANGWANSFYTAAIQAGSQSWKAWFFGSSDMANSITVDKPPASLWIPALSVRVFGLNSWSVLVPEVLMGVASVALLYVVTRRRLGHWAGIGAGALLALTPVAALMFRFDNPEALLILLMIAAVGAMLRAQETGRVRWMILCGVAVGFGFLAKQMEVFLIVPALAVTYFAFGPSTWLRRLGHCFAALGAMIVSAGWWVLTVELWPAGSRPYIGGSQNNSILELTLGYNGFGRLNGNERGSVVPGGNRQYGTGATSPFGDAGPGGFGGPAGPGGRGGPGGMWGETGFWRMFTPAQGGQFSWLVPAALILGVAALVLLGKRNRTDPRRAYLVVFGLWMLSMMATFSYMAGIFHSYYTAAIAPAVAAVTAGAAVLCWRERDRLWVRMALAASVWATTAWAFALLHRTPDFAVWLRWLVLVVGVIAGAGLLVPRQPVVAAVAAGAAILAALAGPAAYTVDTLATPAQGSIVSAGPRTEGEFPGGPGGFGRQRGHRGMSNSPGNGQTPSMPGGNGQMPSMPGGNGQMSGGSNPNPGGLQQPGANGNQNGRMGRGGPGGLLPGSKPSSAVIAKLRANADDYTWVASAIGSNEASGYQIESGHSVMPIGGFNGTDPSPTLEQFKKYVADHKIHYFIAGGMFGGEGGPGMGGRGTGERGTSSSISEWVEANFTARTVDGVTMYDLTTPR